MTEIESFLKKICQKRNGHRYFLDAFNYDFYLMFDCSDDPETPESAGTCDIYIEPLSNHPHIRIIENATVDGVCQFLTAMGISRFDYRVKNFFEDRLNCDTGAKPWSLERQLRSI